MKPNKPKRKIHWLIKELSDEQLNEIYDFNPDWVIRNHPNWVQKHKGIKYERQI